MIVNANRVRENTTGNGTGALALLGAVTNYQTFLAGVGNGNQCYYAITHQSKNEWEVGLGTFTLSAGIPYLSRNTVYNSSNGNLLVDFTAGTKQCAVVYPGTQIDTIASNVGVAAGYANDANTYAQLASIAAVNANLYLVSAAAEASLAGTYAAAASVSYVDAASAADRAVSAAAQVSSVAQEASLALVAASLAQIYKTSASAYATEAEGYASVAQIYKVSASAYATDAANQASIAGVYKASASAFATSAAADASAAAVSRAAASAFATQANDSASAALVYRNSAAAAASAAAVDASLAAIYRTSANEAASAANNYAAQASSSNVSAAAHASMAAIHAASASVAAVSANEAASIAGVYAASASAFASAASRDASLAFIYKTSASAFATSAGADASLALIYRTSASAYATQAADSASLAAYYAGLVNPSTYALLSSTNTFTGANTFTSLVNIQGATSLASTLVTNGNVTFNSNVSVSGAMVVGAGTTSAPSYSTTGDTNTGLYFPAADTIAVATSAVERMRIDSSGNVGIGTSSPGQKLTVAGTVESTSGGFKFPDGTTQSSAASGGVLTGTILDYGGITAPSGYLFCDGSAVSRTTYATLWATLNASSTVTITIASPGVVTWNAHPLSNGDGIRLQTTGALPTGLTANTTYYVINKATNTFQLSTSRGGTAINTSGTQSGTHTAIFAPWGFGDNSTTFNVPDLRGRAGVGRDDMGGTAASRITTAGSGISGVSLGDAGGTQTHTLTTAQLAAHTHTQGFSTGGSYYMNSNCGNFNPNASTGSTGSGNAHQNTQPSAIVNKIIKT